MARDEAYREAERKIEECWRIRTKSLNLSGMGLTELPASIGKCTHLQELALSYNRLTELPESLGLLTRLKVLRLDNNQLKVLPASLGNLTELNKVWIDAPLGVFPDFIRQWKKLTALYMPNCGLEAIPEWIAELTSLISVLLKNNRLTDIPSSLAQLEHLHVLELGENPLNPELAEAHKQGFDAVKAYLRAKATAQITLNEAKLILVGEGEVGKTCLMDALLAKPWQEHPSTHGISIQRVKVVDPDTHTHITLNSWDFGGQRVYRPTHQLFFSAPAVYLVVWKPREGSQAGQVREWIQLIKRREPTAKILVVATHGGPQQRQPDIDHQELWDLFGRHTVIDFFHVDSKPDEKGERRGIEELKCAIARVAASLPEVGRSIPKRWEDVHKVLEQTQAAYLPLERVLAICREHKMDEEEAHLFVSIEHRLGTLIHYQHDPTLRDIVVLKPDWLATAISFVLDDEQTRAAHGLVRYDRLGQLWDDPQRNEDFRYPPELHPVFLRLMERFDLSYRVAGLSTNDQTNPTSLIAQLVPDLRPETDLQIAWPQNVSAGDIQQVQICRSVDAHNGQSASAEGLFYQLIVRLHKYSLGRINYNNSIHWQRGLVLEDEYKSRALLEHVGNDIRITVRAPYPEGLLGMLTREVKFLVESFWEGLQCDVMVPCIDPCGRSAPGTGLYEVEKLIDSKRKGRPEYPCPICNNWQNIDHLLRNAPAAQPDATAVIISEFADVKVELAKARQQLSYQGEKMMGRFDRLDDRTRRILSLVDNAYHDLLQVLTDEAKEGPRLFSLVPVNRSGFHPKQWASEKFRLILWCEHSRLPLPILNGKNSQQGVYELEVTREWFKKAAPLLKMMTTTLSLVLPVAASGTKLVIDKAIYDSLEDHLDFGKAVIDATLSSSEKVGAWADTGNSIELSRGASIRAEDATLRELHALLKAKDPGFGGLVRVMNKRQEFLWVHEKFASEY